jgi:hypothetical protein
MMGGSIERRVTIDGKTYVLDVHQRSKSVWFAIGTYRDKRYDGKGGSEGSAIKDWIRQVNYWADPHR